MAVRIIAVLAAVALSTGCFESPVDESVTLDFREDGSLEVALSVTLAAPDHASEALARRLEEERRALLEGQDAWTRRFERLEPVSERASWEKEGGRLRRLGRSAVVDDPQLGLPSFFSDTDVAVYLARGESTMELALHPGKPARADRRQRQIVRRELERQAERVAAHIEAVAALWEYLDDRPERARVCLAAIFSDLLPAEVRASLDDPDEIEQELIDEVGSAMAEAAGILDVAGDGGYSIDELSRLVFDAFPARIIVSVPGRIELLEGFEDLGGGRLLVRPKSLWQAFVALDGRWLSPDPLAAFAEASLDPQGAAFDLDKFAARERRVESVPSASEVEKACVEALRPAEAYRVVWEQGGGT